MTRYRYVRKEHRPADLTGMRTERLRRGEIAMRRCRLAERRTAHRALPLRAPANRLVCQCSTQAG